LDLISQHIYEIELLDKRRFETDKKVYKDKGKKDDEISLLFNTELPEDPTDSSLPIIDIRASLLKVEEQKRQMNLGIEMFNEKISGLKEIALDISGELDIHEKILDNIEKKSQKQTEEIQKVSAKVKNATQQTNNTTRLCVVVAVICVILIILGIVGVFIAASFIE
jgi:hypothetical protein